MAFENSLYLRKAELIVGPKVTATNGPVQPSNALSFKTRISFEGEQDETSNANKIKISIYNLSEASRTFLEQKNMVVFLKVGYEATGLTTLFFGDIDAENGIHVKRQGPDIITTIEAGDAEKAIRETNINIGLSPGATNKQIIEMAKSKLNLSNAFETTVKEVKFQSGFTYSGSAKKLMDDLGKQAGFNWSVQNGELFILDPKGTDQQVAVLLSQETGLIGYPTKTQDKVEFVSLLNPDIRPGRAVRIESKIFPGGVNLKVQKTSFKGDTHSGEWIVKGEGVIK
jgi:hypothetical protein